MVSKVGLRGERGPRVELCGERGQRVGLCGERGQRVGLELENVEMGDHWLAESSFERKVGGFRGQEPSEKVGEALAEIEKESGIEPEVSGQWRVDVMD